MTNTTTHLIPVELAPSRTAPLHFTWLRLVVLALVVAAAALILGAALVTGHYGDPTTLNEGYAVGTETSTVQVGVETRGTPGLFGHVTTPLGTLAYNGS